MKRKMHLYQHFASDCGRKMLNVCIVCKKSFETADNLKAHKVTHTANDLVCDSCGKRFDSYNQLRAHSIVHKPIDELFGCTYCQKKFRRETSMRSHMAKHTGVKPFQCQVCGERFVTLSKLQTHRKSRPISCKLVQ